LKNQFQILFYFLYFKFMLKYFSFKKEHPFTIRFTNKDFNK
jgi:hypothetical protein